MQFCNFDDFLKFWDFLFWFFPSSLKTWLQDTWMAPYEANMTLYEAIIKQFNLYKPSLINFIDGLKFCFQKSSF